MFTTQTKINEIVDRFPKTGDFFNMHNISVCKKGNLALEAVLAESATDLKPFIIALEEFINKNQADLNRIVNDSSEEQIALQIAYLQQYLTGEFTSLTPFMIRVAANHGTDMPYLVTLKGLFFELETQMKNYLQASEIHIESNQQQLIIEILTNMRTVSNNFTVDQSACGNFRMVHARLADLEPKIRQLFQLVLS